MPERGTVTQDAFLVDGRLRASLRIEGKPAVVKGAAEKFGPRSKVYEEMVDAGFLIKTRGYHRKLRTDLVLAYGAKLQPGGLQPGCPPGIGASGS